MSRLPGAWSWHQGKDQYHREGGFRERQTIPFQGFNVLNAPLESVSQRGSGRSCRRSLRQLASTAARDCVWRPTILATPMLRLSSLHTS